MFVTHQLQYLKDCDRVILLKEGKIAEMGIHDDLMDNDKDYAGLIRFLHKILYRFQILYLKT